MHCINQHSLLKLTIRVYDNKNNEESKKVVSIRPYDIVTDSTNSYNYIVGLGESTDEESTELPYISIRLSNILNLLIVTSKASNINKQQKDQIEEYMISKNPQFMSGELIDIKARLTPKGEFKFKTQLYMRPNNYEKVDEDGVYIFHCTNRQAINYFIKFGNDIEILEPDYLRRSFKRFYELAAAIYNKNLE